MATRRFPLFAAFAFATLVAVPSGLRAQDATDAPTPAPEVPNAPYNFVGEIQGTGVYVRSGPSDSYYPTTKLSKGDQVTVRGTRFNYLKIEPPANSFSYVGKAYVERHGDGRKGRVTTAANVRTGSELNSMKTTVQTKLEPGAEVTIRGEQEEYFKIDPPPGAYLYVQKDFVIPRQRVPAEGGAIVQGQPNDRQPNDGQSQRQPEAAPPASDGTGAASAIAEAATESGQQPETPGQDRVAQAAPGSGETGGSAATDEGTAPSTGPTASQPTTATASADARFEQLEADFAAAGRQSVVEQPVDELLGRYQELVKDESLPESLKRVVDVRIAALNVRKQTRDEFTAVRKTQEEMSTRRKALQAEREELEEQIKATQVEFFAAVGTLRTSSLQQGPRGTMLYRLTDPETGRTLVYVRTSSRDVTALLNQFVGVKGELTNDPLLRLRVITPTEAKAVDQTKVGSTIAAAVIPTSILRNTPTATTDSAPVEGQ